VLDVRQNTRCSTNDSVTSHPALVYAGDEDQTKWVIMPVSLGLEPSSETLGSNYTEEAA